MIASGIVKHAIRIPLKIRQSLLIMGTVGLGFFIAFLITSPFEGIVTPVFWSSLFIMAIAANPLNGLLIWLASQPFTELLVNIELGNGIPDLSLARLCTGFLITFILARTAIGKRKTYGITRVEIAFLLYIVGFGASMVGIRPPSTMLQSLFDQWLSPLIIYFLIRNLVTDKQTLHKTLHWLLVIGVYSAIYMFYELNTGNVLFLPNELDHQFYANTSLRIVRGLYGTTLIFGLIFNWLLPITTYYFLKAPTTTRKIIYGLIIALLIAGDIFTYKRTTWIAMIVSFLVVQWFLPQFRKFFIILVLLFTLVLGLTWSTVGQSELVTQRALNNDEWSSANGRTDRWSEGWALWQQKPLFGHGYRRFDVLASEENVENDYLHIMVSSGLVGIVPYMAFYIFILIDSIKVYRQIGSNKKLFVSRELMVVFWGLYSTYFITAISSSGIDTHFMAITLFLAIIGAIVGSQVPLLDQPGSRKNRPLKSSLLPIAGGQNQPR